MGLRKNSKIQLDFSLQSIEERKEFIQNLLNTLAEANYNPPESELELFSNYILYGKDTDGTSIVDRKEVQINTRYSTYKHKAEQSLDELSELPGFNESNAINQVPIPYRTAKIKFDREQVKDIPEFEPLFSDIDNLNNLLQAYDGKLEKSTENIEYYNHAETLTSQQVYKMRHLLVELRREQYTIKDFFRPTLMPLPAQSVYRGGELDEYIPWQEGLYEIAPLGLYQKGLKRFEDVHNDLDDDFEYNHNANFILDFRNPEHIYELFEMQLELETATIDNPESTLIAILNTLAFYTERAELTEEQREILYYKIHHVPNSDIARIINNKYNCLHNLNYISTIYKQKICSAIAEYANFHYCEYLARREPFRWKKCSCCGMLKLKDTYNFVRKARSSDGLANRCKDCDKLYRIIMRGENKK